MGETTYLSAAETAKLLRQALKRRFPGAKFSVRSKTYSMGASITVKWWNGPAEIEVKALCDQFEGSRFDDSIDLKVPVRHWLLPDGSVELASNPGTEASLGCLPAVSCSQPHPDARLVSLGADFVFEERALSLEFVYAVARQVLGPEGERQVREDGILSLPDCDAQLLRRELANRSAEDTLALAQAEARGVNE